MPAKSIADILGITDSRIWRILTHCVGDAHSKTEMSGVEELGVDETSVKPGHKCVSIFADIRGKHVLFVTEGRVKRTFTNAYGVVTAAATYDDFGNTMANTGFTASPYQFGATSGYRNDGDAGIMQVGARYYDPATGSFLTRDTDLSQLAYVYCGDDPIDKLNPSGHDPALTGIQLVHAIWTGSWMYIGGYAGGIGGAAAGAPEGGVGAVPGGLIGGLIGTAEGVVIGETTWGWLNNGIKWFRDTGEMANKHPTPVPDPWNYTHPFGYFAE